MVRILLVDDDAGALDMFRRGLETDGHHVTACGDGSDASAAFAANPQQFDLIITDVSMPDVDGITMVEGAMAQSPSVRVIVMSGLADELKRAASLPLTRVRMLAKPLTIEQIRAEVRQIMSA